MNKLKTYILLLAVTVGVSSCYDDYVQDYEEHAIYFPFQTDVRTVVVGETMSFAAGVNLAGVIDNKQDRLVEIAVDHNLVDGSALSAFKNHSFLYIKNLFTSIGAITELPQNEYSLWVEGQESTTVLIRKGTHTGYIVVKIDSAQFLSDVSRTSPKFVIPLRITVTAPPDNKILESKSTAVIGVRYENMLFGNYYRSYALIVKDPAGNVVDEQHYSAPLNQANDKVWSLSTLSPTELIVREGENATNNPQMKLALAADGAITISPFGGAPYVVSADGESRYNAAKLLQDRKIFLNYQYTKDGNTCYASDTLAFRNRIRDGVNEWQDENPAHYQ
jgi:hypothetical protein